ncbi:MAG: hypothetical protein NWQ46_09155, partial [Spirosomaceae bacterium]|nr:hypothetical protein [Spirosomataceae bacterium]
MKIFFQTAESIPPPYANEVKIAGDANGESISVSFEQTYLQRDELDDEEIIDEGFSLEDDMTWNGEMNAAWAVEFQKVSESIKGYTTASNSAHDDISVEIEGEKFAPKNVDALKRFIEQLQQAIFEFEKREAPLSIIIKNITKTEESETSLNASFLERTYVQTINNQTINQHWNQLDEHLKLIFAGDYIYEKASNKIPSKKGLYVNLGNEWWFEVGKSLLIQPSKIQ